MVLFSPRPLARPFDYFLVDQIQTFSPGVAALYLKNKMKEHSRKIRSLEVFVGIGRDAITP